MSAMKLAEYREQSHHDPDYLAAEEELRPLLDLADMVLSQRLARGWSQADLAERVGTKQANISRLESGMANPSVKFLQKLANALGETLTIQVRPALTLASSKPSQRTDRLAAYRYPQTSQTTMSAVHDSSVEWQTGQAGQPETGF
jgi:transcriptional regulator with XRE-family HTH domain